MCLKGLVTFREGEWERKGITGDGSSKSRTLEGGKDGTHRNGWDLGCSTLRVSLHWEQRPGKSAGRDHGGPEMAYYGISNFLLEAMGSH